MPALGNATAGQLPSVGLAPCTPPLRGALIVVAPRTDGAPLGDEDVRCDSGNEYAPRDGDNDDAPSLASVRERQLGQEPAPKR
jgi:hypothetical protein